MKSAADRLRIATTNFEAAMLKDNDSNWKYVLETVLDENTTAEEVLVKTTKANEAYSKIDLECKVRNVMTL